MTMLFMLDPRLQIYGMGTLNVQAADDNAGKHADIEVSATQWPGRTSSSPTAAIKFGVLSISNDITIPETLAVFRGTLPALVATASKRLEWDIANGEPQDKTPRRVGEWTLTALPSHEFRSGARSGPLQPNREFVLKVERMSDQAPPFPQLNTAIAHYLGTDTDAISTMGFKEPAERDVRVQQWPVRMTALGAKKVIVDVPLEVKEVVLPFEFKNIPYGSN